MNESDENEVIEAFGNDEFGGRYGRLGNIDSA